MVRDEHHKLIYYPAGNVTQLFDMEGDRGEEHDLSRDKAFSGVREALEKKLVDNLYGDDLDWIRDGRLAGFEPPEKEPAPDFGLLNQRGLHWPPPPAGYAH